MKDCGYTDPDEMVRDRVVIGCHSTKTREKLIQEGSELTLEKASDIAERTKCQKLNGNPWQLRIQALTV